MMAGMLPLTEENVRIVPANEASWDDLDDIFDTRDANRCRCQWFKIPGRAWLDTTPELRGALLRAQTSCGTPDATTTTGLVAYVDDDPAGWVAVEPRAVYLRLRASRIPWAGRDEDRDDPDVWAVTCFVVRKRHRGRGLTYLLARATVDFARQRGARALEAYPMITQPGREITWGELYVGPRQAFEEAGFAEVTHPTPRRVVMRVDFAPDGPADR